VAERAREFALVEKVVVATDDKRVADAVRGLDVDVVLTGEFRSGTERTAAVARRPEFEGAEIVVNLQGDEPFIPAEAVSGAIAEVEAGAGVGTAGARLDPSALADQNTVKVFVGSDGCALAFSRDSRPTPEVEEESVCHHIGVYAYRPAALQRWAAAAPVPEETEQRLEQLRPLSYGEHIGVTILDTLAPNGIDTPADLQRARELVSVTF
jgi:3-deoxy-manno-octulosonate cytidylyltransferase (CMP-KDO synthetase)